MYEIALSTARTCTSWCNNYLLTKLKQLVNFYLIHNYCLHPLTYWTPITDEASYLKILMINMNNVNSREQFVKYLPCTKRREKQDSSNPLLVCTHTPSQTCPNSNIHQLLHKQKTNFSFCKTRAIWRLISQERVLRTLLYHASKSHMTTTVHVNQCSAQFEEWLKYSLSS